MLSISYILIADSNPPNLRDVFMMYCSMTHGTTLRDLCVRFNPQALRIDERKLVQFGLLHKLIRRVHKVITSHNEHSKRVLHWLYELYVMLENNIHSWGSCFKYSYEQIVTGV
jgi:hypothetical protein